jgi:geranylgeranyl diphosphate synthase type II
VQHLFSISPSDSFEKIETAKQIFISSGASKATQKEIMNYTDKAFFVLEKLSIDTDKKIILKQFGEQLMNRNM